MMTAPAEKKTKSDKMFWIVWGWDAVIALVFLYFFGAGIADGSVSSFNISLWAGILLGLGAVLGGSLWIRAKGHPIVAAVLLWALAVPGILYVLFFLLIIITSPRWN
jgi:hypothetical protein